MKKILAFFLKLTPFRIAVALTVLVLAADLTEPLFLQIVELKALDVKFKVRGQVKPHPDIAIIAIDGESINELGRWPWPRATHAKLLERLKAAGAKAVGFDIVFSEPEQNVAVQELVKAYKDAGLDGAVIPQGPAYAAFATLASGSVEFSKKMENADLLSNGDLAFSRAVKAFRENVVLGYFFYRPVDDEKCGLEKDMANNPGELIAGSKIGLVSSRGEEPEVHSLIMDSACPNIPLISKQSEHAGHFYMSPDPQDGTIRWNNLIIKFPAMETDGTAVMDAEGNPVFDYYPSLGLKMASVALGKDIKVRIEHGNIEGISLDDIQIPTDEKGRLLVNYAGELRNDATFKLYAYSDVLSGKITDAELKDKIFLVAPTAVGIYDLRNTPFDPTFPGVGVHANVIDNIVRQKFLQKPTWMKLFDFMTIAFFGLTLGLLLGRLKGITGALLAATVAVSYYLFTQYAFSNWGIWLSTVYPELQIGAVFAAIVTFKYMTEERQAKQIRGAFSNYVTPSVVDQVLQDPSKLKLGGEMRDLTVMFSDIRGFTTISEKLTPEQLVDLLNAYLSKMTDIVFKYDGTLDKYIGDALMAIWGAPVEQPDHAKRACFTAIEMMSTLELEMKPKWDKEGLKHIPAGTIPTVDIGIGLNSGNMSVGNMGSDQRFDYTVMGDNVNLASRLEGTNKAYGTNIIISEATYERCRESVVVRELDSIRVKGKYEPVRIYELMGKAGEVDAATLERAAWFEKGLAHYRKQEWDQAEAVFNELSAKYPKDETAKIFLERVAENREESLPADWDGVYVMKTK